MKISQARLKIQYQCPQAAPEFAQQVEQLLTYLAEKLGIKAERLSADDCGDDMRITLQVAAKQACVDLELKDQRAQVFTEHSLQGMSGIAQIHGRREQAPRLLGVNYVTTMTAINVFTLLLAQQVSLQGGKEAFARARCSPLSFALLGASQYIADAAHEEPWQRAQQPFPIQHPPFRSKDGVLFEMEALDAGPWRSLWQHFGLDSHFIGASWKAFQLRYAKAVAPLPQVMYEFIATKDFADIREVCQQCGVAITPVNSLSEQADTVLMKGIFEQGPWHFSPLAESASMEVNPMAEGSGFLPSDLLQGAGQNNIDNKASQQSAAPLSGLTLVESCRRIQGPLAGHLLSLLGAEVIRIEPPGGDPLRGMQPTVEGCSARFAAINGLKKVVEVDIKSAQGKQQIYRLAAEADGFFHNWAPGKAEQLSLDAATLARFNPQLVYTYAGGWSETLAVQLQSRGATAESPAASHGSLPGTDFVVQAFSGVAAQISVLQSSLPSAGKISHTAPEKNFTYLGGSLFTVLDTLGGALAAQGMVAALLARSLGEKGAYVETSLLAAATLLENQALSVHYRRDFCERVKHRSDIFATATKPIVVSLLPFDQDPSLRLRLGNKLKQDLASQVNLGELSQMFTCQRAEYWISVLAELNIPAALVTTNLAEAIHQPALSPFLESHSYHTVKLPWSFQ